MSRPRTVKIDTFHLYDKLHTKTEKMYSGVEITCLFPMKETANFFVSCEVWAYCCSKTKVKKTTPLEVNIPILKDSKTINFLEKNCWSDYNEKVEEFEETKAILSKIFPNHVYKYFFEMDSIISSYCSGSFVCCKDGVIVRNEPFQIEMQKYLTRKYNNRLFDVPQIKALYDLYLTEKDEQKKKAAFTKYYDAEEQYAFENLNLTETFIEMGKNVVCLPMAFTENTAEWSKEKYGKLIGYAHAGEVYFIVTEDTIYYEVRRHF